ncbi:MAG: alanine--tRNA ligase [Deltaproteobacteria bacterium]|nr:alanine--tRNA ligase [Deltaproteobacteria bacterium]
MKGAEIREAYLEYFESKGHQRVGSSSLVPRSDPSLFFTNAGMVQFKDLFLGLEKRDYVRATSTQKCMRVSGKHNDLENVGRTARHHTFFEMLGNFSFGDYFKKDAISFGWEFLTRVVNLDPDRLTATVFQDDDEAYDLWEEIAGLPTERIVRLGEKDNFWSMGDTGPCGPCSEIIYDQGEKYGCGEKTCGPACDCGRFLELWNLVFMQYNRDKSGKLAPLPKPSIDTGMGLERLTAVLQGQDSNYHTDLVFPYLQEASRISGVKYGAAEGSDVSLRVIADHIRAVTFLVADGVFPSSEGRGYVLRRIMRRAARHGKLLGLDDPFLYRICPLVGKNMGGAFPELEENMDTVVKAVHLEEERFVRTLDQGLRRLSELMEQTRSRNLKELPGDEIFRLYDTFGFPLDLSEDIASESGMTVDVEGFNREMELQKKRARAAWTGSGEEDVPAVYRALREKTGTVHFIGYEEEENAAATIVGISEGGRVLDAWSGEGEIELVLDHTPFYGESGGQAGDTGLLEGDGFKASVFNTTRPLPDLVVHHCRFPDAAKVKLGDICTARIDHDARSATRRNHTATHLLQAALRRTLGEHVKQSGSLVNPSRLRFDFTHFSGLLREEIERIEDLVNGNIMENISVKTREMSSEEAMKEGAMALFGEKYGDVVRVVSVPGVSMELCGGTHVNRTGDIGLFRVLQESSVAAGVRRIEAVTGAGVLSRIREEEDALREMAEAVKVSAPELPARIRKLLSTIQEQEKKIRDLQRGLAGGGTDLANMVKEAGGIKYLAAEVPGQDPTSLRDTADRMRDKIGSGVVLLGTRDENKAYLVCVVSRDLVENFPASELINRLAPLVDGRGGGRPDMAQAGGKRPGGLDEIIGRVGTTLQEMSG